MLLVALALAAPADAMAQRRADPKLTYAVPVGDSPVRGPQDALITLVTACEFSSPLCRRIRRTLDQLMSVYEGDLRIAHKHFVVYKDRSLNASLAACAAHKQGHFFEMEAIIWTLGYRARRAYTVEEMTELAQQLDLDMRQFQADMNGPCQRTLEADKALMQRMGARGVPASFINGRYLAGSQTFQKFTKVIDEELAKAKQRLAQGAKPSNYYREFVVAKGEKEAAKYDPRANRPRQRDDVRPRRRYGPDPDAVYAIEVGDSPVRGPADAKVTMILGCQFAGPYCKRIQPTLSQLRADYDKDLRIVYKHLVVHRHRAKAPALSACAAHRQGKYFEMAEVLWGKAYDRRVWDAATMRGYAEGIGLDMKRYDKDIKGACPNIVKAEEGQLRKVGARGTPSAFINGRFLSGARPLRQFKALIDEELAKANALIKNRKQQKRYYRKHIVGKGKKTK